MVFFIQPLYASKKNESCHTTPTPWQFLSPLPLHHLFDNNTHATPVSLIVLSSTITLLLGLVDLQFLGETSSFLTSNFCSVIYVMMQCKKCECKFIFIQINPKSIHLYIWLIDDFIITLFWVLLCGLVVTLGFGWCSFTLQVRSCRK